MDTPNDWRGQEAADILSTDPGAACDECGVAVAETLVRLEEQDRQVCADCSVDLTATGWREVACECGMDLRLYCTGELDK